MCTQFPVPYSVLRVYPDDDDDADDDDHIDGDDDVDSSVDLWGRPSAVGLSLLLGSLQVYVCVYMCIYACVCL